jgi:hypothetical protein
MGRFRAVLLYLCTFICNERSSNLCTCPRRDLRVDFVTHRSLIHFLGNRRRLGTLNASAITSRHAEVTICAHSGQENLVSNRCIMLSLTLTYFPSLDNWQTGLRKQYARRDPAANPIGFEPKKSTAKFILEPIDIKDEPITTPVDTPAAATSVPPEGSAEPAEVPAQSQDGEPMETDETDALAPSELKDWFDLPMLTKLDSLHLLTEWQFQNPNRIRTIMKNDDETAQWVGGHIVRYSFTRLTRRAANSAYRLRCQKQCLLVHRRQAFQSLRGIHLTQLEHLYSRPPMGSA